MSEAKPDNWTKFGEERHVAGGDKRGWLEANEGKLRIRVCIGDVTALVRLPGNVTREEAGELLDAYLSSSVLNVAMAQV